ncbi:MAG: anaerobic sulfatase maturase [Bacteroidales bacterium]|nr:anaerobic sulfatase maturase [Bacteroidales bacterium]
MMPSGTLPLAEAARLQQTPSFDLMLKPVGSRCNLGCSYCYYLGKAALYGGRQPRMSTEVLEAAVRSFLAATEAPEPVFVWHGGEPLLAGMDFFERALELQRRYSGGRPVRNAIQTNGTLLTPQWASFLAANRFLAGISIDGPKDLHERYRGSCLGKVLAGLKLLQDSGVEFNTLTTVNHASEGRGKEVYAFLKEAGSRYMQFLPVVEYLSPGSNRPAPWSVSAEGFGRFMIDIFDEWVRHDVGEYFVQLFDSTLAAWCGQNAAVCTLGRTCQPTAVVEHNGDVYACDHCVSASAKLGNVLQEPLQELMALDSVTRFSLDKYARLPQRCLRCGYLPACNGECPTHRDPQTGVSALCSGYRLFFDHTAPAFDKMRSLLSQGRAPKEISVFFLSLMD